MINKFDIKNFKSHSFTSLKLSNMNVLTGLNGMGKSSVIQALLLLRQTYQKNTLNEGLELKGDLCNIGVAKDALYLSAEDDTIEFSITSEGDNLFSWAFYVGNNDLSNTFIKVDKSKMNQVINYSSMSLFNKNFQYISAFRNGPTQDYEKDTSTVEIFHQISKKEGRCELIAHYLDFFRNSTISDLSLRMENTTDDLLLYQVKNWLQIISPEIDVHIEALESSYRLNYSFSRGKNSVPTEKFRDLNIGFGISYTLPIIVVALHSPKDSLIIIENPEAHIHPSGQAKLMELLCKAAKAGVQFIIETHSDHIINGLLVACKKEIIDKEDINIYFFDRDLKSHSTKSYFLPILEGIKIKHPPEGFFDQIDKDMETLMGF